MTNIRGIKDAIHTVRKEKGYTQQDMADKLNISQPAYSYYEKGDKPLPVTQLDKVLSILDLEVDQLQNSSPEPLEKITIALNRIGDLLEDISKKM